MTPAMIPLDEAARLLALDQLGLLDTPADPVLDGLVRSAAAVIDCPIAVVSLVDRDRQWFKARTGIGLTQTARDAAFCAHTILGDEVFEVPDAALDPRFADNPLVSGEPHVRFYAGAPLVIDGFKVGTLGVIDRQPRRLSATQRELLVDLAHAVRHWIVSWRANHELRETQGIVARMADMVPGLFFQHRLAADGTATVPFASNGIRSIYEVAPDDVRHDATLLLERVHPDDLAGVRQAVADSARALSPLVHQYRVRLPERGERWLEGHATPERLADGAVLWSGFIQDITARRELEQMRLEKLTVERASQARSEFVARLSHELRTPLNAVLGFTQLMLLDTQLPERTQVQLGHVRTAGQQLLHLIDDLLDLARIEQSGRTMRAEVVDLSAALESSLALIEPLASERGIRLMPVQGPAGVRASADARALGQVLLNLLSNAVKYNRERGRLWAEVRATGNEVAIGIGDEGKGLSDALRQRLFRPFDRLGAEEGRVKGSGLGLVITKQLVEAMKGRLEVHDRPEGGCRFEVWLPADPAPDHLRRGASTERFRCT